MAVSRSTGVLTGVTSFEKFAEEFAEGLFLKDI
jgi:hypothetical protein